MAEEIEHTEACKKIHAAALEFDAKHPHACPLCGGAGSHYHPGNREQPPEWDACDCVEQGKCPMCSEPLTFEEHKLCDYGLCKACGWDEWKIVEGKVEQDVRPDDQCCCWEEWDDA